MLEVSIPLWFDQVMPGLSGLYQGGFSSINRAGRTEDTCINWRESYTLYLSNAFFLLRRLFMAVGEVNLVVGLLPTVSPLIFMDFKGAS